MKAKLLDDNEWYDTQEGLNVDMQFYELCT